MNDIVNTTNDQNVKKPSVTLPVIYFAGLGLVFGGFTVFGIISQSIQGSTDTLTPLLVSVLIYLVVPEMAAWGISQYKKWGRTLGLIISWLFILVTGFGGFNYLSRVSGNFSLAAIITLFLYLGVFVASVLVVRFLSNHKDAFS